MGYVATSNELKQNGIKKLREKQEIINFLTKNSFDCTHAVTLTFPFNPKDTIVAERYFGSFKKYINERCFRRKKSDLDKIKIVAVLEGEIYNKKLHYHCALRCPPRLTYEQFEHRIAKMWRHTVKDRETHVDIQHCKNRGWIEYLTKELSATHTKGISIHNDF